jgi:hypothetical protein
MADAEKTKSGTWARIRERRRDRKSGGLGLESARSES